MKEAMLRQTLGGLIVRKDHVLCSRCWTVEPVHPGDGTPAATFIAALHLMADRHRDCFLRIAPHEVIQVQEVPKRGKKKSKA